MQRRKLQVSSSMTPVVEVVDGTLLQYGGDLLASREDKLTEYFAPFIFQVVVSQDENTVYYVEAILNGTLSVPTLRSAVRQVGMSSPGSTSGTTIQTVAGPWPLDQEPFSTNSSLLMGLSLVDTSTLLVVDSDNELIRKISLSVRNAGNFTRLKMPRYLTKHPTLPQIFVSSVDRIMTVPLSSPSNSSGIAITTLAGFSGLTGSVQDYLDSSNGADVRFNGPMHGPRSISGNGDSLYVADSGNNVLRRVDTQTGATVTVAGTRSSEGLSIDGDASSAQLGLPEDVAVTSNGCNVFVAEGSGAIRWITLNEPNGTAIKVKTIVTGQVKATSKSSNMEWLCITLTHDDKFLVAGTGSGGIYWFTLNSSHLHNCSSTTPSPVPPSPRKSTTTKSSTVVAVAVSCSVAVVVVVGIIAAIFLLKRNSEQNLMQPLAGGGGTGASITGPTVSFPSYLGGQLFSVPAEGIREFSFQEIQAATEDLNDKYCVQQGGAFGKLYRAFLTIDGERQDMAIKVMKGEMDHHKYKQFLAEVQMLSKVRHKNLCRLAGYFVDQNLCILVYPFIVGGSLHDRLHGTGEPLTCRERMSVAEQVATGLHYLHHGLEEPILHRDIKSHNLLVKGKGEALHAYLIDFGLARPGPSTTDDGKTLETTLGGQTVLTLVVCGTPGYMAPEYQHGMQLTPKNDVYAFGAVLLELVTGQKAQWRGEQNEVIKLVAWCRQWLTYPNLTYQQFSGMVDAKLMGSLRNEEWDMVYKLAMLGHKCTSDLLAHRPDMNGVMEEIRGIQKLGVHHRAASMSQSAGTSQPSGAMHMT
ncbi:hypothetical protein CBR_g8568 [Chara braunii]|uniref:Protein kinase domain-containing protein n=1 Tax=Chara braunii TaxID=69332 RepID=A0A388JRV4_CHABU|nr:hypothetical protein CBR_g8568 [Chara braunii]|eukprot:GBG60544.1 hypothetical protein CBR_g8568 [Chara braunii]